MKVFVAGTRGFPKVQGGVEKHCEELYIRIAKKKDIEVVVVTRDKYMQDEFRHGYKNVKFIEVSVERTKYFEAIMHTFRAILIAKREGADIMHIHAIGPSILIPLAKFLGLKTVMTHHGFDYRRQKWGRLARFILRVGENLGAILADKVIVISKDIEHSIQERFGRKEDMYLIPNGIDLTKRDYGKEVDEVLDKYLIERKKYLFTALRFVPEKGILDLIEAFLLSDASLSYKLVIAGDDYIQTKYCKEVKSIAGQHSEAIVLTGFITGNPLNILYENAALFVLPSYHEGLPIALLEAMSKDIKVLASDITANLEVGLPKKNYFKVGKISSLKNKMDVMLLRESSKNIDYSRELIEKYDWDTIAVQTMGIYKSLME